MSKNLIRKMAWISGVMDELQSGPDGRLQLSEVAHHQYIGTGPIEHLQRRVAYGGRKGRAATRRLRWLSRQWCTDRALCKAYFTTLDASRESQ